MNINLKLNLNTCNLANDFDNFQNLTRGLSKIRNLRSLSLNLDCNLLGVISNALN